jgi:hypothetical protein
MIRARFAQTSRKIRVFRVHSRLKLAFGFISAYLRKSAAKILTGTGSSK